MSAGVVLYCPVLYLLARFSSSCAGTVAATAGAFPAAVSLMAVGGGGGGRARLSIHHAAHHLNTHAQTHTRTHRHSKQVGAVSLCCPEGACAELVVIKPALSGEMPSHALCCCLSFCVQGRPSDETNERCRRRRRRHPRHQSTSAPASAVAATLQDACC